MYLNLKGWNCNKERFQKHLWEQTSIFKPKEYFPDPIETIEYSVNIKQSLCEMSPIVRFPFKKTPAKSCKICMSQSNSSKSNQQNRKTKVTEWLSWTLQSSLIITIGGGEKIPTNDHISQIQFSTWVCLKMLCTLNPMVLLIIIPFLNGYFIGNIPTIFRQTHIYIYILVCIYPLVI